jgi:hypothetical protein
MEEKKGDGGRERDGERGEQVEEETANIMKQKEKK